VEELRAAGDPELGIDLSEVLLDGLLAVPHHRADLGGGQALQHQPGHLFLLAREARLRQCPVDQARQIDIHAGYLVEDLPQRLGRERLLQQIRRAGVQRRLDPLRVGESGDEHHRRADLLLAQRRDEIDSGHLALAEDDVGHHGLDIAEIRVVQRALDARMRQAIPAERLQSARKDGAGVGLILDEQDGPGSCAAGGFGSVGDHRVAILPLRRAEM